jgi:hypothetical protein
MNPKIDHDRLNYMHAPTSDPGLGSLTHITVGREHLRERRLPEQDRVAIKRVIAGLVSLNQK